MTKKHRRGVVEGEYTVFAVDEASGLWTPVLTRKNLLPYSWGFLACQAIGLGNPAYKVAAAYLEYTNVGSPGDAVAAPSYDRTSGLAYFNALPTSTDFLRVALVGPPTIDIAPGFESYFSAGVSGNRVTFQAQSSGTLGVLGRAFSAAANSKVYGLTLVATPVPSDRTRDVILSRGYFSVSDQQLKRDGLQVGVRWAVTFK